MTSLIKHFFKMIDTPSYFILPFMLIVLYLGSVSPIFLFTVIIVSLPIMLFYYVNRNRLNRFMISLPISARNIVQSRYYFFIVMTVILLIFQLGVMLLNSVFLSNENYIYNIRDVVVLICMSLIIISFIGPIFHLIKSFMMASMVSGLIYLIGTSFSLIFLTDVLSMNDVIYFNKLDAGYTLLVETYIPFQPYLILIVVSVLLYFLSMKVSEWLFIKRERII